MRMFWFEKGDASFSLAFRPRRNARGPPDTGWHHALSHFGEDLCRIAKDFHFGIALDGFFGLLIDPFCDSIGKIVLAAVLANIRGNILENDHRTISFQRNGRRAGL